MPKRGYRMCAYKKCCDEMPKDEMVFDENTGKYYCLKHRKHIKGVTQKGENTHEYMGIPHIVFPHLVSGVGSD